MIENKIQVYIEINGNNCITQIESSISSQYIDFSNWILIDEGEGDKYAHAQNNYFPKEKPLRDMQGRCNYKYVDSSIVELSDEEKETLYPPIPPHPPQQEVINAQLIKLNADVQLQLKNQMLINAQLLKQIAELKGGTV